MARQVPGQPGSRISLRGQRDGGSWPGSDEIGEFAEQGGLRPRPDEFLDDLTADKNAQRGDVQDVVPLGDHGVLVDVQLDDVELVAMFLGDGLQHGRDYLAWTAPFG